MAYFAPNSKAGLYSWNSTLHLENSHLGNVTAEGENGGGYPVSCSHLWSSNSKIIFDRVSYGQNLIGSWWNATLGQNPVQLFSTTIETKASNLTFICPTDFQALDGGGTDDDDDEEENIFFSCISMIGSNLTFYNSSLVNFYFSAETSSLSFSHTDFILSAAKMSDSTLFMEYTSLYQTIAPRRIFWLRNSSWEFSNSHLDLTWKWPDLDPLIDLFDSTWRVQNSTVALDCIWIDTCGPHTCASVIHAHNASVIEANHTTLHSSYQWKFMFLISQSSKLKLAHSKFQSSTSAGFVHTDNGRLVVENSKFENNFIFYDLFFFSNQSTTLFYNSTFNNNAGSSIIKASRSNMNLTQSSFSFNKGPLGTKDEDTSSIKYAWALTCFKP